MATNPNGYVQANDFGNPRVINGEAREIISGGQLVGVSGATGVIGSGLDSYATNDVKFILCNDSENLVGIAQGTAASGTTLAVAVDTVALLSCAGSVYAGRLVKAVDNTGIENLGSQAVPANAQDSSMAGNAAGRALTAGASGGFALVHFKS